ncbi:MAG TPA: hypothetical protein VNF73_01720 [Candidatus Saccharimonadales bacterium]|nr:hypothetical protein [Candidatus Saccharimonadales bacterium]
MTPTELLGSLRRRGIQLVPAGDGRLRYRPRAALSEAERAVLVRHRHAILALFDADPIGWRTAVMAAQMARSGAIPLLLARPGIRFPSGSCRSCGDPRPTDRYRCAPCAAAAVRVLAAVPTAGAPA